MIGKSFGGLSRSAVAKIYRKVIQEMRRDKKIRLVTLQLGEKSGHFPALPPPFCTLLSGQEMGNMRRLTRDQLPIRVLKSNESLIIMNRSIITVSDDEENDF